MPAAPTPGNNSPLSGVDATSVDMAIMGRHYALAQYRRRQPTPSKPIPLRYEAGLHASRMTSPQAPLQLRSSLWSATTTLMSTSGAGNMPAYLEHEEETIPAPKSPPTKDTPSKSPNIVSGHPFHDVGRSTRLHTPIRLQSTQDVAAQPP